MSLNNFTYFHKILKYQWICRLYQHPIVIPYQSKLHPQNIESKANGPCVMDFKNPYSSYTAQ